MNKRQIREYQKLKRQMENIKLFFGLSAMFVLVPGLMLVHWIVSGIYKMNKRQIREYQKLKRQMENIKLFFGLSAMFVLVPGLMLVHWIVSGY